MKTTTVARVKEIIGADGWFALCEALPDKSFTIPKTATPNHFLSAILGIETANKLCDELAGDYMTVPMSRHRQQLIRADLAAGMRPLLIAKKYYMCRRTIERERRRMEAENGNTRQISMF